jgi:hypothetical protein
MRERPLARSSPDEDIAGLRGSEALSLTWGDVPSSRARSRSAGSKATPVLVRVGLPRRPGPAPPLQSEPDQKRERKEREQLKQRDPRVRVVEICPIGGGHAFTMRTGAHARGAGSET